MARLTEYCDRCEDAEELDVKCSAEGCDLQFKGTNCHHTYKGLMWIDEVDDYLCLGCYANYINSQGIEWDHQPTPEVDTFKYK